MIKKDETKVEKVNQPAGAFIAGEENMVVDRETLSHQYQKDSPAVDTNVSGRSDSVLDKIDTKENLKARQDAAEAAADAVEELYGYDVTDCSKLDVSDARYCQPGSDRHKAFLKAKK